MTYKGFPVDKVHQHRGKYVAAVLTIIQAWRKAVETAQRGNADLLDAMREFPVEDRGEINRSKLGWLLKKHANRIVGGFEFQKTEADGRTAWRVVAVETPPLPPLPASSSSVAESVTPAEKVVVEL